MGTEKIYENKIKSYLKSIGAYFIKTHGDRFSKVGTPDILACVNGKFVAKGEVVVIEESFGIRLVEISDNKKI